MASVNSSLSPLTQGETVRDYKHASRTFVDNNFELQPRYGHLFHVIFEFTTEAATLFNTVEQLELPILVKSVDLPTYTIDVQTHNQYNRKVQSHHAINYNPIGITFHDDVKELIRTLWHKYYIFYNADPTYGLDTNSYTPYDKYSNRVQQQWGLQRGNKRFFKSIKIYSMHNHKFAEYTLVNPIITAFNHDNHAYTNGMPMQNTMQLAYETVKYATGYMNNINPRGFGDIHYDAEVSDLSAGNVQTEAFINGQTVNVAGQNSTDLFQGNVIGVIKDAEIIYDQDRLGKNSLIQDTAAIFLNNLLTGKKPTSNSLVPVTGKLESEFAQYSKNSFVEPIAQFIENARINPGVVSSGGKNIQTTKYNNITNSSQYNVGFANSVPRSGSVANPNKLSDNTTYAQKSTYVNSRPR